MEKMVAEDVVIVGAGIAGLATPLGLKRVGIRSLVLERSHELRPSASALVLGPNAWRALDALGVAQKLASIHPSFTEGYSTDMRSGHVQKVNYPSESEGFLGVRLVPQKVLLQALAEDLSPEAIRFSSKLTSITQNGNQHSSSTILHMEDGTIINAKVLIGCDGVNSEVGRWLGLSKPICSGKTAIRGLSFYPHVHGFEYQLLQFVDGELKGAFIPLTSTCICWSMVIKNCNQDGDRGTELFQKDVLENLAKDLPEVFLDVVRHVDLSTLSIGPLTYRFPLSFIFECTFKQNVTVVGDAMHPIMPDLYQGGCMALEDAVVLSRHIGKLVTKDGQSIETKGIEEALAGYLSERRWRVLGLMIGSYLSGWVKQPRSSWWAKFIRDQVFYRFFSKWVSTLYQYDCGKLPSIPPDLKKVD